MSNHKIEQSSNSYNSPLEVGLRTLIILAVALPKNLDLQRIIYFDYLIVHTNDTGFKGSPPSLHPDTPHRYGEIIVRRKVMQQGLDLMYSKSLLNIVYNQNGINYSASELTQPFLDLFDSKYYLTLKSNALWVTKHFSKYSELELKNFIEKNIGNWGGEFMYEAFIRSVIN